MNPAPIKQELLTHWNELSAVAKTQGLHALAAEIAQERIPKLERERFSVVVLGEFNHGKSTFVNALLGNPVLPTGITPTTATINHIMYAAVPYAKAVLHDGSVYDIDPRALQSWVTTEGADNEKVRYVEVGWPASLLKNNLVLVDTPGVNDINETRADITYRYLPNADVVLFLLDATQLLKQSERTFLEQRLLQTSKKKLLFVLGKIDLLSAEEQREALAYGRKILDTLVPDALLLPVSAKQELQGQRGTSGFHSLLEALHRFLAEHRTALLLDNSLNEALRLCQYVRQHMGLKQRALQLSVEELETRIAQLQTDLNQRQQALRTLEQTIVHEIGGIKAKLRVDVAQFATAFCEAVPKQIAQASAKDIELYLHGFLQDTIKAWAEHEGEQLAGLLERLAEQIIRLTNENINQTLSLVSESLGVGEHALHVRVDGLQYDVGLFALGALGTGIGLFVNAMVGGALALAVPVLGMVVRTWQAAQIKRQASEQAPQVVRDTLAVLEPKLSASLDAYATRLRDFVQAAGHTLYHSINDVLTHTLAERKAQTATTTEKTLRESLAQLEQVEARLHTTQQALWTSLNA